VKRLASRVIYLEHGVVLADLPVEQFFQQDRLQAHSAQAAAFVKGELG
jgi:tungstate transport system ATP-binding protein